MFNVSVKNKRVVIGHKAKASNGGVDLHTTLDFHDVPMERILEWAAKNKLDQLFPTSETERYRSSEVKKQFDDLVIDCKDPLRSHRQADRREEAMIEDLSKVMQGGVSIERLVQFLIRRTRNLDH